MLWRWSGAGPGYDHEQRPLPCNQHAGRAHFGADSLFSHVPVQAQACAWLGHWYREVAQNYFRARNCYRRSLALEPGDTVVCARPLSETLSKTLPALVWSGESLYIHTGKDPWRTASLAQLWVAVLKMCMHSLQKEILGAN